MLKYLLNVEVRMQFSVEHANIISNGEYDFLRDFDYSIRLEYVHLTLYFIYITSFPRG